MAIAIGSEDFFVFGIAEMFFAKMEGVVPSTAPVIPAFFIKFLRFMIRSYKVLAEYFVGKVDFKA